MEETFDQKIFRNVQNKFLVYKTTEVVGDKAQTPNLEWENPEKVDEFFQFANHVGTKIIYITEGEEVNEDTNESHSSILQVGFLYQGIMHHINIADESDDEEDKEEYEDSEYEDESYDDENESDYEQESGEEDTESEDSQTISQERPSQPQSNVQQQRY
ncbi:MAG: hypothetical protein ACOCQQ_00640 [Candidatus Nanoarchaeia archaeon]